MADNDTVKTSLRLPPELHDELRQEAFKTNDSINAIIIRRLSEYRTLTQNVTDLIGKLETGSRRSKYE